MTSISVVINNYNYAHFLAEAVDAALEQIGPEDEIVIVDDGSTDGSATVLAGYRTNDCIRIVEQSNQGQLRTVLNGMAAARGEVLALLDSDDYFLPGYLNRLRALAKKHPEIDFFFAAAQPGGDCPPAAIASIEHMLASMALAPGPTGATRYGTLHAGEFVGTPTSGLALRRGLAETLVGARDRFQDSTRISDVACRVLRLPRDSHTTLRLSADGIIVRAASVAGALKHYCPQPGFFYRLHSANAYARIGKLGRTYLRLIRARHISRLLRDALDVPTPTTAAVVEEARARSLPLKLRRRLRLILNYTHVALRSRGRLSDKALAMVRIPRALLGNR